ncbi:MAG: hypothetical protein AB8B60_16740 [Sulfitobacter sp.]
MRVARDGLTHVDLQVKLRALAACPPDRKSSPVRAFGAPGCIRDEQCAEISAFAVSVLLFQFLANHPEAAQFWLFVDGELCIPVVAAGGLVVVGPGKFNPFSNRDVPIQVPDALSDGSMCITQQQCDREQRGEQSFERGVKKRRHMDFLKTMAPTLI